MSIIIAFTLAFLGALVSELFGTVQLKHQVPDFTIRFLFVVISLSTALVSAGVVIMTFPQIYRTEGDVLLVMYLGFTGPLVFRQLIRQFAPTETESESE